MKGYKLKDIIRSACPSGLWNLAQISRQRFDRHLTDFELRRNPVQFIIAGAQKSGTSALASFIATHPEIAFCMEKEPNFFLASKQGVMSKSQYHRLFPRPCVRVTGEASVGVMYEAAAIQRVKRYNPNMKVIAVLRNPIARAYSHYQMHVRKHNLDVPFLDCIRLGDQPLPSKLVHNVCHPLFGNYIDWSRYVDRVNMLQLTFDKVLIIRHEELLYRHSETLERVFEFLSVDPKFKTQQTSVHASPEYTIPLDALRLLTDRLAGEIDRLEKHTRWDLSDWRAGASNE